MPVIKAAPSFVGMGVLTTDEYVNNGGNGVDGLSKEWYVNTVSLKNSGERFRISWSIHSGKLLSPDSEFQNRYYGRQSDCIHLCSSLSGCSGD
jgi:hypothetical protein